MLIEYGNKKTKKTNDFMNDNRRMTQNACVYDHDLDTGTAGTAMGHVVLVSVGIPIFVTNRLNINYI